MAFRSWPSLGPRGPRVEIEQPSRRLRARLAAARASLALKVELSPEEVEAALARVGRGGIPSRTVIARAARGRRDPDLLVDPAPIRVDGVDWTVARVFAGRERDIADDLTAMGFRCYCPLMRVSVRPRRGADLARKRVVRQKPVFAGYLFIGAPAGRVVAKSLHEWIVDVLGDVERRRDQRVVKAWAELIEAVNRRELSGAWDDVKRGKTCAEPAFEVDDWVRVKEGPFALFSAIVKSIVDERVCVEIGIFGRNTPVTLAATQLEPA